MYNCYNEAVRYLQGKYGTQPTRTGMSFTGGNWIGATKTKHTNTSKTVDTHKTPTTITPDGQVIDRTSDDDKHIKCLLGQYFYGIDAQRELYFKLVYMGIMEDKENRC